MSNDRDDARAAGLALVSIVEATQKTRELSDSLGTRVPGGRELSLVRTKLDEARLWLEEYMRLAGMLVVLLVAACGDNDEPAIDAGACSVDACVCRPEWPGCPPGCAPPVDAGLEAAP